MERSNAAKLKTKHLRTIGPNNNIEMSRQFNIQLQNQFATLADRTASTNNMADRMARSPADCSRTDFASRSVNDKLIVLFDEMKSMQHEQINCGRTLYKMQTSVENVAEKLGQVIDVTGYSRVRSFCMALYSNLGPVQAKGNI